MNRGNGARATGILGEQLGEAYLKERGYRIIARNVRSPFGEIDVVADHDGTLVFIEIKTRRDQTFGIPEEAVDHRKKERLIRLASWYLARGSELRQPVPVRFDVLAIEVSTPAPIIRLIQDAFQV